jgi:hypothetical protein
MRGRTSLALGAGSQTDAYVAAFTSRLTTLYGLASITFISIYRFWLRSATPMRDVLHHHHGDDGGAAVGTV